MRPALQPGDRLLVGRWLGVRRGDVITFRDPEHASQFGVKRVTTIEPNGDVVVRGDNVNVSRDSRHFGPIPRKLVTGRVFFRYLPADRRARL